MSDVNVPRSGSLQYKPKTRASRQYPVISNYPEVEEPKLLDFPGYKAGMTRVKYIERKDSPNQGREVAKPVTVLETPPVRVYGVRAYQHDPNHGKQPITEVWTESPSKSLQKATSIPRTAQSNTIEDLKKMEDDIHEIRLLVHTQPEQTGISYPTPANYEAAIGGTITQQMEFAEQNIGGQLTLEDSFSTGEITDAVSITKGQGMEGPVQRHGIKKLGSKTQKKRRKAGNVGPWHPDTLSWRIPLPGQQGFNKRTEINKRIMEHGEDHSRVQKEGGFNNYGQISSHYTLVKGSVPGPTKRLVRLRKSMRNTEKTIETNVNYIRQ